MDDGTGHIIRLHSVIGMGAYGTVFKAFRLPKELAENEQNWSRHAVAVAVKQTVFTEVADDIRIVLKEVSYLTNLRCSNIVSYFTAFTNHGAKSAPPSISKAADDSATSLARSTKSESSSKSKLNLSLSPSLCIVEELVDGASVAKVLKSIVDCDSVKSLGDVEIASVLYDVLQALLYIHEECRLVHRDIKPLNMLLDSRSKCVKLCDFGTCADVSQEAGRFTVIGTIGWIAPEVLDSGMMDVRSGHVTSHSFPSDIWSLGVSALEMAKPSMSRPALSEYIKDLSVSPCSVEQTVETSRKSFLHDKLPSNTLRDFIACCLRKDPKVRPTVRQLLDHPLIVANGVAVDKNRRGRIALLLEAVHAAQKTRALESAVAPSTTMADDGFVLPELAYSTVSKNRCMEAFAAIKRDFFLSHAILAEKTRTSHYVWCIPQNLTLMLSSDEYRYMPSFSRPQGLGQVPSSSRNNNYSRNNSGAPLKPLFDSVVLPSTVDSQRVVFGILRKHRKLGLVQVTEKDRHNVDRRGEACYTVEELSCSNLKYEVFAQLHDDLLRAFKAVCIEIPDFVSSFLSTLVNSLTVTHEGVESLQRFAVYLHQLQSENLMHTHCGRLSSGQTRSALKSPLAPPHASLPQESRALNFAAAEDWLRFPRMPQSVAAMSADNNTSRETRGGKKVPTGDEMRQPSQLVNPSAYLFNKWLKEKQKMAMGL